MGYLNLKCNPSGELNVYDEPIKYNAYGINYNKEFVREECVLIRNNYLERPTDDTIRLFAMRLYEAERTIDVNIKQQKTPLIIKCDEKTKLTVKNIYKNIDGNEPVVIVDKSLDTNMFQILPTLSPFITDKVMLYKKEIWNECMSFLGVNNANTDKKERLITDEVNANNELINIMAQTMLLTRQEACDNINKLYGLDMSVTMREFGETEETFDDTEKEEGENDG